jgi:hypothetical protein
MRRFVVASLTVLMLVCGASASANASGWRDLRIDASSDARFNDSIQQMRDELPYHRAVLFVLVLQDLKARFAPAEYRHQLNGLAYNEIIRLGSAAVADRRLMYYATMHNGHAADPSGATTFQGFSGVANPFGAFPGFDQTTGKQLPAP